MANLQSLTINDTGSITAPVGTTAQRPVSPVTGGIRYNSTTAAGEAYTGSTWITTPIPATVLNGMILELDAANYTHKPGVLNSASWTLGSGGAPGFNQNGATIENERISATDAWGRTSVVWETRCTGAANDDGGWNSDSFSVNVNLMYRFCVWVKRTSATSGGTFYLGTGGTTQCVYALSTNAQECNPYWDCIGTSAFTQNDWNLVIGHQFPSSYTLTAGASTTGVWNTAGTKVRNVNGCNIGNDCKSGPSTTASLHRTYHYYSADSTTRLQFAYPRVDIVNGNEPSLNDLLTFNNYKWVDSSNGGNSCYLMNIPSYNTASGGSMVFGGVKDYATVSNSTSLQVGETFSVSCWINADNLSNRYGIFSTRTNNAAGAWQLEVGTGNSGINRVAVTGSGTWIWESSNNAISAGTWMNICYVKPNNATQGGTLYINGVALTPATTTAYTITNNSDAKQIAAGTGLGQFFPGMIAYTSLYNRALSESEVQQNFQSQRLRFGI
jgi:hypothetical protein